MKWFTRQTVPEAARDYLAAAQVQLPRKMLFEDIPFIVLDTETSGFKIDTDRLLSIAAFPIIHGRIDVALSRKWLVFQHDSSLNQATTVHGILPEEIHHGFPEKTVLEELLPMVAGSVVVGHHIWFDAAMLNAAMTRHFQTGFRNKILDTATMAMYELVPFHKIGYAKQHPPKLEEICSQLDIPPVARHTAEGDAFTTAEIFMLLCGRARHRLRRPLQLRDLPVTRFSK